MTQKITTLIFSLLLVLSIYSQEEIELINYHLERSHEELVENNRIDLSIFHAVQAENYVKKYKIKDYTIRKDLQLKFIGAFRLNKDPLNARKHLTELLNLTAEVDSIGTVGYFINSSRLASDYMRANEMDSATKYFQLSLYAATEFGDPLYISSGLNNLGIFSLKNNQWEVGFRFFEKAENTLLLSTEGDSTFLVSIRDNKADYYFHKKDSAKAIALLEGNFEYFKYKNHLKKKAIRYGVKLGEIYLKKDEIEKAEEVLTMLEPKLENADEERWYFEESIKFYELKLKLAKIRSDVLMQNKIYAKLNVIRREHLSESQKHRKGVDKTMADYFMKSAERKVAEEKQKTIEAEKNDRLKTILIVVLALIFIILFLLVRVNFLKQLRIKEAEKKLKEQELELTENRNKKLNQDLEHKTDDFSNLLMQVSLKEGWNEKITSDLRELTQGVDKVDAAAIRNFIRNLKQKSSVYDKVELQQKGIKDVNSAFFDRLDQKFPNLTKGERELCGLIKLRLDGKEIAVIRNIHPSSVRKLRHRLRKKLEISSEHDLYDFVGKI